jgi:hypothetical protein
VSWFWSYRMYCLKKYSQTLFLNWLKDRLTRLDLPTRVMNE